MKRYMCILLSIIMIAFGAGSVLAEPAPVLFEEDSTSGYVSMQTSDQIIHQSGFTWKEWNKQAEEKKKLGLQKAWTLAELQKESPTLRILESQEQIVGLIGKDLPLRVADALNAYQAAYSLTDLLGGGEDTRLLLKSEISIGSWIVYVFQEIGEGQTIVASTVRIITDRDGQVTAVFSSLQDPSSAETVSADDMEITADQAELLVEEYYESLNQQIVVFTDYTAQILLPQEEESEEVDSEEELLPDLLLWVVYTENPAYEDAKETSYPYLAHYLSADGTWLYSNEVQEPGDEAGQSGYQVPYLFDGMEESSWSGTVTRFDGTSYEITVPVMKDTQTGIYYLGDVNRRIVFGEYYDFAYGDEELIMLSSPDNTGWREDDLITYDNYLAIWDTFARKGWTGPDGNGTPTLLLRDMCLENGEPMENAAYCGNYRGWQIFAYDHSGAYLGEGLDVMAHEFSHCVTQTAQGENLYYDDYGAINESFSDILGSLCEMEIEGTQTGDWLLGEDTGETIRSMLDPHQYEQPEYVWDVYYGPHAYHPNDANDRGGVHSNSSILNLLAAKLCAEYGMNVEDAWRFWLIQCCLQTPLTDLVQMQELLPMALEMSGNDHYQSSLADLMEAGKLSQTEPPEHVEDGKRLVSLQLPDTEAFADDHWMMMAVQVKQDFWGNLFSYLGSFLFDSDDEEAGGIDIESSLFAMQNTWVSDESNRMTMVINDRMTMYFLLNMDVETFEIRSIAVLFKDQWMDLSSWFSGMQMEDMDSPDTAEEEALYFLLESGYDIGKTIINQLLFGDENAGTIVDGNNVTLSAQGLEQITLPTSEGSE